MPKSLKEAILATTLILLVSTLLSFALLQTETTSIAEKLRTSGFVDEDMAAHSNGSAGEPTPSPMPSNLLGIVGITIRQTLQIVVPLLFTLRVLKSTRQRKRQKRTAAA